MKTWEELTPRERRVELAKDALKYLVAGDLKADSGNYVRGPYVEGFEAEGVITPEHCDMLRKECKMCAKGALFVSRIGLFNSVSWGEHNIEPAYGEDWDNNFNFSDSDTVLALEGAFSINDLLLIESVFECSYSYAEKTSLSFHDAFKYEKYGRTFETKDDIFRAICLNIIENGEFVLPVE